ncbi:MreB/Mbl protein [Anaplasma phagocytophilum]|nr:MreB/Mbl protein [Anaplasma phagocytophilum]
MLKNLDVVIAEATGLQVTLAANPLYCVALGVGKVLENMSSLSRVLFRQN